MQIDCANRTNGGWKKYIIDKFNEFKTVISEKEKQIKYEYVSYSDWITK